MKYNKYEQPHTCCDLRPFSEAPYHSSTKIIGTSTFNKLFMETSHWILKQYWRQVLLSKTSYGDDFEDVGHPFSQWPTMNHLLFVPTNTMEKAAWWITIFHKGKTPVLSHLASSQAPRLCFPDVLSSEPGVLVSYEGTILSLWETVDTNHKCLSHGKYLPTLLLVHFFLIT